MTTSWSAQTNRFRRHGSAATRTEAWRLAIEEAVELATTTGGTEAIRLEVGEETGHLFPALDAAHRYDQDTTGEFARQLVDVLEAESIYDIAPETGGR